MGQEL